MFKALRDAARSLTGGGRPSAPAGEWLAQNWRKRPDSTADNLTWTLTADRAEGEAPTAIFSGADESQIREAVTLVVSGAKDSLLLRRKVAVAIGSMTGPAEDPDEEFLQASRTGKDEFTLAIRLVQPGENGTPLVATAPLSPRALAEAILDYRRGGRAWIGMTSWRYGP
jgi:hypothetical protein